MLFSRGDDPQEECKGLVMKYKECMGGMALKSEMLSDISTSVAEHE